MESLIVMGYQQSFNRLNFGLNVIKYVLMVSCAIGLFFWSLSLYNRYLDQPTSSTVMMRFGDDDDQMVRFPVATLCREFDFNEISTKNWTQAWRNQTLCKKPKGPPYFLTYLEDCLEINPNASLKELLKNISYDIQELLPKGVSHLASFHGIEGHDDKPLENHEHWEENKEKIMYDFYNLDTGHCITIDVSHLRKDGKVSIMDIYDRSELLINQKLDIGDSTNLRIYLHDGMESEIYALHRRNNPSFKVVRQGLTVFRLKKTKIESLPTKTSKCGKSHYGTCIKNQVAKIHHQMYQCHIPFLETNSNFPICPNDIIIEAIKTLKYYLITQEDYYDCQFIRPCHDVLYETLERHFCNCNDSLISIQFDSMFVQVIKDSYSYPFELLMTDFGGAMGMLLGSSLYGFVEIMLSKLQKPN